MFRWFVKLGIVTIITLLFLILIRANRNIKNGIYDYVYSKNISFATINRIYKKTFATILANNILIFYKS